MMRLLYSTASVDLKLLNLYMKNAVKDTLVY
jgi:hypothetical protein